MDKELEAFLEKLGWTIECWSPYEISHTDGSFASGQAANYLVDGLKQDYDFKNGKTF